MNGGDFTCTLNFIWHFFALYICFILFQCSYVWLIKFLFISFFLLLTSFRGKSNKMHLTFTCFDPFCFRLIKKIKTIGFHELEKMHENRDVPPFYLNVLNHIFKLMQSDCSIFCETIYALNLLYRHIDHSLVLFIYSLVHLL